MCNCDDGFFGPDCSLKMCSKGDDPMTINQNYRELSMTVYTSDSSFYGTLGLQFMGKESFISLSSPSSTDCTSAMIASTSFTYLSCKYTKINQQQYKYTISIYAWPIYPAENNLHTHNGNPAITDFFCDISDTSSSVYCTFADINSTNIREYVYCSNRGNCDFTTGLCSCDDGFGGPACSNLTYSYQSSSYDLPGQQILVNEVNYQGNALQISSVKSSASDFYFIKAIANDDVVFSVRGDGLVGITKMQTISGGQTISSGGLYILSGGCTILNNPINVYTTSSTSGAGVFSSLSGLSLNSSYSVVKILSSSSSTSHFLLKAYNQNTKRFGILSTGQVNVYSGGLLVTGGQTIYTNGLNIVNGGLSIRNNGIAVSGGISVNSYGIAVTSGITINTGGLKLLQGGMQIYAGGVSIYSGGLKISGGGLSLTSTGIAVTGGVTINSGGLKLSGGLTVNSLGLYITSGGLTVATGGIVVTSGLSINSLGAHIAGGLSISTSGGIITGGLTVHDTGLVVSAGGISVTGGGTISGGVTVTSGDIVATSSIMTVASLYVLSGLTVGGAVQQTTPSFIVASDRRLKTNIQPLDNALHKLSKIKGVYFNWRNENDDYEHHNMDREIGVIAQDIQDILPEAVNEFDNKYLGVDYKSLIPLLIQSINELQSNNKKNEQIYKHQIHILNNQIKTLTNEIDSIKQMISNIQCNC